MFRILTILFFSLLLSLLLVNLNLATWGMTIILILIPIMFARPQLYFILFLLTRPALDIFSQWTVVCGLNIAAISGVVLIIICGVLLFNKNSLLLIKENRFLVTFNVLFLFFLTCCLLSSCYTRNMAALAGDILRLLSVVAAVNYTAVYFSGSQNERKLVGLILLSSIIPLGFGAYQFVGKKGLAELGFNRLYGTFTHPNVYSQYLLLIFLLVYYILVNYRMRMGKRVLVYLFWAILLAAILFTYTRGTWIALGASLILYSFFRTNAAVKGKFILFAGIILIAISPYLQKRFSDINDTTYYRLSSWQWRLQMWQEAAGSLQEHPVIGNGLGMYEQKFNIMAHNDYLRILYETGLLGLFFYLSILLYVFFVLLKKTLQAKIKEDSNKYKIALCLITSLLIMSAADNLARSTIILVYLFVIIGHFLGNKYNESPAG